MQWKWKPRRLDNRKGDETVHTKESLIEYAIPTVCGIIGSFIGMGIAKLLGIL